jgi:hypothetical protein
VLDPTADPIVAATHFGMLATLSVGILGSMHQFVPVITGRPLRSICLSWISFAVWLAASWMLPLGVATEQLGIVITSGILAAAGMALICINLIPALSVKGKGVAVAGLRLSLAGAVVTTLLGVTFVFNRQGNWFQMPGHVDLAMAVTGLFGWLGLTYIAVSQKLWPMFFLAHVPGKHIAGTVAIYGFSVGSLVLALGLGFSIAWLSLPGAAILATGLGAHLRSLVTHIRHRRRKADLHLVFVVTSAAWIVCGVLLALGAALLMENDRTSGMALMAGAVAATAGWLLTAIAGHAYKVVPFISWSNLRSHGITTSPQGKQIMFSDLYNHHLAAVTYLCTTAGIATLVGGFSLSSSWAIAAGGAFLAAAGIVTATNLSVKTVRLLRTQGRMNAATVT